jgi:hypothetical protein
MKLWLDDLKDAPVGWRHVKTAGQAIAALDTGEVEEASLDYDILWDPGGDAKDWENKRTGMAVVLHMERTNRWPVLGVSVHSTNKEGRARMEEVLRRNNCLKTTSS